MTRRDRTSSLKPTSLRAATKSTEGAESAKTGGGKDEIGKVESWSLGHAAGLRLKKFRLVGRKVETDKVDFYISN